MARPPDPGARDRVLDAADRLLVRVGYRRMTVAGVAAEAGVGKGSVYLHVASKEALALAGIERMVAQLLARLEREAAREAPADVRLRRMLELRVMHRVDATRAHAASLDDLLADIRPALFARRRAWFAREAALFTRVVRDGQRAGALAAGDAAALARALVDGTNALLPASLTARELGGRAALRRKVQLLAELLVRGLERTSSSLLRTSTTGRSRP